MNWIIIDKRLPAEAKEKLSIYGSMLEFESTGIVYDAISGHPDIFMCRTDSVLIIAPNTPEYFSKTLSENHIPFKFGNKSLGRQYPETSHYNAVITEKFLIHNLKHTDNSILEACNNKIHIHTKQAYTRCNLLALDETNFITSDKNIEKNLLKQSLNVLYVSSEDIFLPGFSNGFFGGCCGIFQNKLMITGNLKYLNTSNSVLDFIKSSGIELIELFDGRLFDAGGLFFINS